MARRPAGERRPKAAALAAFYDYARKDGWHLNSRAWPHYVCIRINDTGRTEVAVVQVAKHRGRRLRSAQHEVMLLLSTAGIPCYLYNPEDGMQEFQIINTTSRGIKGESVELKEFSDSQ